MNSQAGLAAYHLAEKKASFTHRSVSMQVKSLIAKNAFQRFKPQTPSSRKVEVAYNMAREPPKGKYNQ